MAAVGKGLSGSDRIFIELSKNLRGKGYRVTLYLWEEGYRMCQTQGLTGVGYILWHVGSIAKLGFFFNYVARIIRSVTSSLLLKLDNNKNTIIYSASDFWMDSIPGWILKMRYPKVIWVGTFYLKAPSPFLGFRESGNKKIPSIKDTIYWFMQKPTFFLIKNYANLICVTSDPDVNRFPDHKKTGRYLVIKGGVNLSGDNYSTYPNKIYDGVFQGRFHEQKGVLELVEIWQKIVNRRPNAKLAMIGDGPLFKQVQKKIIDLHLTDNIELFGYLFDGTKKDKIFKQSKVVVHPAIYDSGGMATAEAMAVGLPGVSFDLKALESYYPHGLFKAKIGDLDDFADKIIELLINKSLYNKMSEQAIKMIKSQWSWEHRTDQFVDKINEVSKKYD